MKWADIKQKASRSKMFSYIRLNNLIVKLLLFRCSVSFGKFFRSVRKVFP